MSEKPASLNKINWGIINGLRGLAALYVVIHHSRHALFGTADEYAAAVNPKAYWSWWEWLNIIVLQHTNLGVEFVTLFFVLSGFSIAHSLANKPDLKGFYTRRLIRLYPTYLMGIIWALAMYMVIKYAAPEVYYTNAATPDPIKSWMDGLLQPLNFLKTLFYIPHNNYLIMQYWSLPFEVVFYLLAPFMLRWLKPYGIITVLLFLVGAIIYGVHYQDIRYGFFPFQFTFDFGVYFLVGILFYKYKSRLFETFRLNKFWTLAIAAVLFEILVVTKSYIWHTDTKATGWGMVLLTYILLFGFLKHNVRIKPLEKIGEYSYTLYVTHMASIHIVCVICWNTIGEIYHIPSLYIWYAGIVVAVFMAYALYWVAEYPSTKYLERWRKNYKARKV